MRVKDEWAFNEDMQCPEIQGQGLGWRLVLGSHKQKHDVETLLP